ncbi:MAG: hypothetical protein OSA99_17320 [Acidimicrobiales bacterium]|nr:hypothetical protein [Acidimicrobiales bacterium]
MSNIPQPDSSRNRPRRVRRVAAALALAGGLGLAACGGGGSSAPTAATDTTTTNPTTDAPSADSAGQVLPVTSNPITNTATDKTLTIDSVLVENNVDTSGAAADDHLEIAVSNTGSTDLTAVEVYYTITDPTTSTSESYYTDLGADFTVPAGGSRTIHFDNTGATDHFPANQYSLYYTSTNQLDVEVEVSAQGAAVQTATVNKDAGGAEVPD